MCVCMDANEQDDRYAHYHFNISVTRISVIIDNLKFCVDRKFACTKINCVCPSVRLNVCVCARARWRDLDRGNIHKRKVVEHIPRTVDM